ncbi:hypothetical protein J2847_004079 [Azospirillum agricola]|uniref:hypothetical protein n=1 Tax=Azospirillum agricola TaxID=1720247 RepID=UPI001AE889C8|nr:hypothetical protein [Azospirillum agricola]MBP2230770.1 hypothetical protein [Azospirillum agricola]
MTTDSNRTITPEQLATALEGMAVNPKGGKMASIAYRHSARLIRDKLAPSSSAPGQPQDTDATFWKDQTRDLQDFLKKLYDAPTMEAGYAILADWGSQFWYDGPAALKDAQQPGQDVTERAKAIAWAHWQDYHPHKTRHTAESVWASFSDRSRSAWIAAARAVPAAAPQDALPIGYIPLPQGLHPDTAKLVTAFAEAVAAKLRLSEIKYGWTANWSRDGWRDELVTELLRHVHKGDPRDVAAYCAFAWHHGWDVSPPAPGAALPQQPHPADAVGEVVKALDQLLIDVAIAQGNMRDAAKRDHRWEGCAEAIQPRVDAARAALRAARQHTGEGR